MSLNESGRHGELMDLYVEAIEHLDKNRLTGILGILRETGWRDGAESECTPIRPEPAALRQQRHQDQHGRHGGITESQFQRALSRARGDPEQRE